MKPDTGRLIDWRRIYPHATHRWNMGLRPGDASAFFAARDASGAVLAERTRWLAENPGEYAALLPEPGPALDETVGWARELGADVATELPPWEQLLAVGRAWEADFVWMQPGPDGLHRLIGGVVCFPSMWALRDKIGRTMDEVHGPVPDLNNTLGRQIEAFMTRLRPGEAWVRENLNFSRNAELNHHPARPHRAIDATVTAEEFWLRFEHQLLLRLPASGSVLFGIRIEMIRLSEVLEDPAAGRRLGEIFATMSADAAAYKGIAGARSEIIALCFGPPD